MQSKRQIINRIPFQIHTNKRRYLAFLILSSQIFSFAHGSLINNFTDIIFLNPLATMSCSVLSIGLVIQSWRYKKLAQAKEEIELQFNTIIENPESPIITAVRKNDTLLLKQTLKKNIDVNIPGLSGESPLIIASRNGNLDFVQKLISTRARVNDQSEKTGTTALHEAAKGYHIEVIRHLLENKANPNLQTMKKKVEYKKKTVRLKFRGDTPLITAIKCYGAHQENPEASQKLSLIVDLLLTHKADVNIKNMLEKKQ